MMSGRAGRHRYVRITSPARTRLDPNPTITKPKGGHPGGRMLRFFLTRAVIATATSSTVAINAQDSSRFGVSILSPLVVNACLTIIVYVNGC